MSKLVLYSGMVGDYDGAYNWVLKEDEGKPEYAVGLHKAGSWLEDSYRVVEVTDGQV